MRTAEVIWHCGRVGCDDCDRRAYRIISARERFERRRAAVESFLIVVGFMAIGYLWLVL